MKLQFMVRQLPFLFLTNISPWGAGENGTPQGDSSLVWCLPSVLSKLKKADPEALGDYL